jgi:hypothetical protein
MQFPQPLHFASSIVIIFRFMGFTYFKMAFKSASAVVIGMILLIVFIPAAQWNQVAGQNMLRQGMHHWNFFVMGPLMSFMHGKAFGTEFYSQYGVGWPMVFAALSPVLPATYGHMIGLGSIYGCVYYFAIYLVLRVFCRNRIWPAFGVLLHVRGNAGDAVMAPWAMHTHFSWEAAHQNLAETMTMLRAAGYQGYYSAEHHSAKNEYVNTAIQLAKIQKVLREW